MNEGILTRRDFNILFENNEGKKYIPVETTDSIYVYSNVILSGNFFDFVNKTGLNVCFIDKMERRQARLCLRIIAGI